MSIVPIDYLAVVVAAASSMLIGALWYGPLFGKAWMALSGMSAEGLNAAKAKGMTRPYLIGFVGSLVMSYVLAHALEFAWFYFDASSISAGLMVGFWNWLGFIAPVTLGAVLWENKPWKLWMLNNAYYLVSLLVMGMILAAWL